MADFCLQCWNKLNGTNDSPSKYIISKKPDLCEACDKLTPIIMMERKAYDSHKFRFIIFPFKSIYIIFILPRLIYNRKTAKNKKDDLK